MSNTNTSSDEIIYAPSSTIKIIRAQQQATLCRPSAAQVGPRMCKSTVDNDGLLVRKAHIDGAIQIMLPSALRQNVLMMPHYPTITGYPSQRRMYKSLKRTLFWPHMAAVDYCAVRNCTSCDWNIPKYYHSHHLRLLPTTGPLKLIAIYVVGPLPKTVHSGKYFLLTTDFYSKITRAVRASEATATHTTNLFVAHWLLVYVVQAYFSLDDKTNF